VFWAVARRHCVCIERGLWGTRARAEGRTVPPKEPPTARAPSTTTIKRHPARSSFLPSSLPLSLSSHHLQIAIPHLHTHSLNFFCSSHTTALALPGFSIQLL
jgi:hypothetical protein